MTTKLSYNTKDIYMGVTILTEHFLTGIYST